MYRCKFSDFDNYIKDMYKNVLIYRKYTKQYSKMIRHYISDLLSKELGKGSVGREECSGPAYSSYLSYHVLLFL